jgi:methylenetetrahydrofolate reductase (NADPH)
MPSDPRALKSILARFSLEITARDDEAFHAVADLLAPGSEVFIANLPHQECDLSIGPACRIRAAGLEPVPHLVARNIRSEAAFDDLLACLARDAGVDRAMILGGDREEPAGPYAQAFELVETGRLMAHGIRKLAFACFPEGHPRVATEDLRRALRDKVGAAERAGHEVLLVSQFVFKAQPVVDFARRLRAEGIPAPLRVGVSGPADRATLLRFGAELGAGRSLEGLEDRAAAAGTPLAEESPEWLLREVALARAEDPSLAIQGIHFFPFGSTAEAIQWAQLHRA